MTDNSLSRKKLSVFKLNRFAFLFSKKKSCFQNIDLTKSIVLSYVAASYVVNSYVQTLKLLSIFATRIFLKENE